MQTSTLFMPDISGFTKFVKSTEIDHGKHIIEELINLIIEEGSKVFEVAEIEGDAVSFYKFEQKLSIEEINDIARRIFVAFYKHLSHYEYRRICNCGACTQAVDLKLKFIVHSGEISLSQFNSGNAKPFGAPVIAVHRLLKNKIGLSEYILFSDDFIGSNNLQVDGDGFYEDPELGKVPFQYIKIENWRPEVLAEEEEKQFNKVDIEVDASLSIPISMSLLQPYITDFKYRHYWNKEADEIIFDDEEINKAGTKHHCIIKGKDFHFDTIKPKTNSNELSYGEVLKNPAPFKYFETNYFLSSTNDQETSVRFIMRASVRWKLQLLLLPIIRKVLQRKANEILQDISKSIPNHELELKGENQNKSMSLVEA